MATIEEMTLYGLRNFVSRKENRHTIEFSSPLTLFLGDNGCGKTTIIEALKFACSGDVSGGSKDKQRFVYDPRLNKALSSRGEVHMRFADSNGNKFEVVRPVKVKVTDQEKPPTFKALKPTFIGGCKGEGNLDEKKINDKICEVFDVSKEMLDNVILCHQEDTAWPLKEPKKVKEKFDKIFGVVAFNTRIETLKQTIDDKDAEITDLKSKVDVLLEKKECVDEKQAKVQDSRKTLDEYEDDLTKKENMIVPIAHRLEEISKVETQIGKLEQLCSQKETERRTIIDQQTEIRNNIIDEFKESDQELRNKITLFQSKLEELERKDAVLQKRKEAEEMREKEISTLIGTEMVKMVEFKQKIEWNQRNIEERDDLIKKLAKNLNIEVPVELETKVMVCDTISTMSQNMEARGAYLQNLTRQFEKEEHQLQEEINKHQKNLFETKLKSEQKCQSIDEIDCEILDIKDKLQKLDCSDKQLKNLQTEAARVDADLQSLISSSDPSKMIEENKQKISEYGNELEKLKKEKIILQQNNNTEEKLKTENNKMLTRESEINKLKSVNLPNFEKIFGEDIPVSCFENTIERVKESKKMQVKKSNKTIEDKEEGKTRLEIECESEKEKLHLYEKELQESVSKVSELCNGETLEAKLTELQKIIKELYITRSKYSSKQAMYEKFLQKFQSDNPCCPVCQTDFVNRQEAVDQVINSIRQEIKDIPKDLEKIEEQLQIRQECYNKILQIKPECDRIEELKVKTTSDLEDLENRHHQIVREIEDLRERLSLPLEILNACNEVLTDSVKMDKLQHELNLSKEKCDYLKSQLIKVSSNRSKKQTKSKIEEVQTVLNTIQNRNDQYYNLREKKSLLERAMQFQNQITKLSEKKKIFENEVSQFQKQLISFESSYQHAEDAKKVKSQNTKLAKDRNELSQNQKLLDDIEKIQKLVEDYIKDDIDGCYIATVKQLDDLETEARDRKNNILEINKEVIEMNKKLSSQKVDLRNLEDNLSFRRKREQVEGLSNDIKVIIRQIKNCNSDAILEEKRNLSMQRDQINRELNQLMGRTEELKKVIQGYETEINLPKNRKVYIDYNAAHEKYIFAAKSIENLNSLVKELEVDLIKFYKKQMVEIDDLRILEKNLDRNEQDDKDIENLKLKVKSLAADLINFHEKQMEEINIKIRQHWRSIYNGNDLDYIKIRVDETETKEFRRVFHYKVVQIKNGVEIDMRSCGSTGQKAVACLVIRMALAEAFSNTCGILVLDEPTSYLDRANIISLSEALGKIVNSRQSEKRFQLLVFTHNKEFLTEFKSKVNEVSYFWKVSRDENGNSVVTKESF